MFLFYSKPYSIWIGFSLFKNKLIPLKSIWLCNNIYCDLHSLAENIPEKSVSSSIEIENSHDSEPHQTNTSTQWDPIPPWGIQMDQNLYICDNQ